jgi:hypothetical protein
MKIHQFNQVQLKGSFLIKAEFTLKQTAEIINKSLGLNLEIDKSGYYEEFPAFSVSVLNVQMVLLGVPEPEFLIENQDYKHYNFQIMDNNQYESSESINLGTNFIYILNTKSELKCNEEWTEGQVLDDCINIKRNANNVYKK